MSNYSIRREAKLKRRTKRKDRKQRPRSTRRMPPIAASMSPQDQMKQVLINLSIWLAQVDVVENIPTSQLLSHFASVPHWFTQLQRFGNALKPEAEEAIMRIQTLINEVKKASDRINAEIDVRLPYDTERATKALERRAAELEKMREEVETESKAAAEEQAEESTQETEDERNATESA